MAPKPRHGKTRIGARAGAWEHCRIFEESRMNPSPIVRAIALLGIAVPAAVALAQGSAQRIEITGSSIKRVQSEGALPIQVIRAEEIARQGITSAEQLVSVLAANGSGVDNMTSNQGGDFLNSLIFSGRAANNGSSAASLRGLGPQNTLVLLNGRRVSPHGLNGKSVDLNTIPMAAIDRIEILKDGASAIYGTDAIGGVINFILKRDYTGLEVSAFLDATQHGGGNIARGHAVFGTGNLESSGFNFLASLTFDKQERLRGSQRDFHNGFQPERGLAPDTSGTPYATIAQAGGTAFGTRFSYPAGTVLPSGYVQPPGVPDAALGQWTQPTPVTTMSRVNPLNIPGGPGCDSQANTYGYRGDVTGFHNNDATCTYDYGKDWSLMQPVQRLNFVGRGQFKLGRDHTATVELTASKVESRAEYTPNQITTVARGANYPAFITVGGVQQRAPYYKDLTGVVPGFNNTLPIRIRWRCLDCGNRIQDTESETYRALFALEGVGFGWDYRVGVSTASSKGSTNYLDGYLDEVKFKAAMDTGLINPWVENGQRQTPEAMALIEGAKFRGSLYGGEAKLDQIDAVVSRELMQLPAGPLAGALGLDLRKESFQFNDRTQNHPVIIGAGSPASLDKASRKISALFGELQVPIIKNLDGQFALRHDRYDDFGSTTNPKVALRFQPTKQLLLRASAGRGFHAPDFGPLYEGENSGQFTSDINDPLFCATNPGNPSYCNIRPSTLNGGNPELKPEKSKQWSFGIVFEPVESVSLGVDFWQVEITDRIANRTPQEVIDNHLALAQYIVRDAPASLGGDGDNTTIDYVRGGWLNVAGDKVRGADLSIAFGTNTSIGRLTAKLDGTYLDSYKTRKYSTDPWSERVSQFGDFDFLWDLKQRWKHSASLTWAAGNWSVLLAQSYKHGYRSEVDGYGSGVVPPGFKPRISAYTLHDLSVTWTGLKNTTLTAGVKNLFDKDPPFSAHNVDNVAGAGWDARVGDPRGRAFTFRVTHKFF
jgi:iron complex outermembrane receptor protein